MEGCLACDLAAGRQELPGGRIYQTEHWLVEHCVGPLPVGTLVLKPRRHCLHIWDLKDAEVTLDERYGFWSPFGIIPPDRPDLVPTEQ